MTQVKVFDGIPYRLYDAYPTKPLAEHRAKQMRTPQGSLFAPHTSTLVRVVDLGVTSGRLRYALYIRPGE